MYLGVVTFLKFPLKSQLNTKADGREKGCYVFILCIIDFILRMMC